MVVDSNSQNLDEKIVKVEKGNFSCPAFACAIFEQNIYTLEPSKVNVRTFQVRRERESHLLFDSFFFIQSINFKINLI
jgi:hypothetical protein